MLITLCVFLIIFSMLLHEFGHAIYMHKYGLGVDTISLGYPFPIKIRFRLKRVFDGMTLQLTPLLIGAYAKAKYPAQLPYNKMADIYSAGALVNILFGGIILTFCRIIRLENINMLFDSQLIVLLLIIIVLPFCNKIFSRFIALPLGVSLFCYILWVFFQALMKPANASPETMQMLIHVSNIYDAFVISAILSIGIGLLNLLPILPMDGGLLVDSFLENYCYPIISLDAYIIELISYYQVYS